MKKKPIVIKITGKMLKVLSGSGLVMMLDETKKEAERRGWDLTKGMSIEITEGW